MLTAWGDILTPLVFSYCAPIIIRHYFTEETKEQIEQLEQKLKQLEKEKQKLFMQLKKLLNEDEVRKRQQQKESK